MILALFNSSSPPKSPHCGEAESLSPRGEHVGVPFFNCLQDEIFARGLMLGLQFLGLERFSLYAKICPGQAKSVDLSLASRSRPTTTSFCTRNNTIKAVRDVLKLLKLAALVVARTGRSRHTGWGIFRGRRCAHVAVPRHPPVSNQAP